MTIYFYVCYKIFWKDQIQRGENSIWNGIGMTQNLNFKGLKLSNHVPHFHNVLTHILRMVKSFSWKPFHQDACQSLIRSYKMFFNGFHKILNLIISGIEPLIFLFMWDFMNIKLKWLDRSHYSESSLSFGELDSMWTSGSSTWRAKPRSMYPNENMILSF